MKRADILLAVEDDGELNQLAGLLARGHEVDATDTDDLLRYCKMHQPDVLLLGANYGGAGKGLEWARDLKLDPMTRQVSIILLVERSEMNTVARSDVPPDEVIARPVVVGELVVRLAALLRLRHYMHELLDANPLDPLTAVLSRAHVLQRMKHEHLRAARYGRSLTLALIDLDQFSDFNASQGSSCGDQMLREVARALISRVRGVDLVSRFGEDEFAVVLPETSLLVARLVAERLRSVISGLRLQHPDEKDVITEVTASVGVVGFPHPDVEDVPDLLRCAREALKSARDAGGNNVVLY